MAHQTEQTFVEPDRLRVIGRRGSTASIMKAGLIFMGLIFVGLFPLVPALILADRFSLHDTGWYSIALSFLPLLAVLVSVAGTNRIVAANAKLVEREIVFVDDRIIFAGKRRKKLKDINTIYVEPMPRLSPQQRIGMAIIAPIGMALNFIVTQTLGRVLPGVFGSAPTGPTYTASLLLTQLGVCFADINAAVDFQEKLASEVARRRGKPVETALDSTLY